MQFLILFFSLIPQLHAAPIDPFIGSWEKQNTNTWMVEKPENSKSTVQVARLDDRQAKIKIQINGHHACYAEGVAIVRGKNLNFDSNLPAENQAFTNSDPGNPCRFDLARVGGKLKITNVAEGCKADCGANAGFSNEEFARAKF